MLKCNRKGDEYLRGIRKFWTRTTEIDFKVAKNVQNILVLIAPLEIASL